MSSVPFYEHFGNSCNLMVTHYLIICEGLVLQVPTYVQGSRPLPVVIAGEIKPAGVCCFCHIST